MHVTKTTLSSIVLFCLQKLQAFFEIKSKEKRQHWLTSKIDIVILLQLQLGLASIGNIVYVVLAT